MNTRTVEAPARTRYVGRSVPTRGADVVVTGELEYLTDLVLPDMLHGKIVRADVPHGRLAELRTEAALKVPGVVAVLTAADVPHNISGVIVEDQPVLVDGLIRQVGDPVALVAAETVAAAEAGAAAVEMQIERLPTVSDPHRALEPSAPPLHADGNLLHELSHERGDVEAALAAAAVVIEHTYETQIQEHVCLEPGGGVGLYENGRFTIWVGTQMPGNAQAEVARALEVEPDDVRIISTPVGGSFGSKLEGPFPIYLALLAKATGRAVRIVLTREEVMAVGAKRHPFRIHSRLGLDRDGRIVALDTDATLDAGPYAGFSPAVVNVTAEASTGPYGMPNARFSGRAAYTNNSNSGAFRGFGVPQMLFPLESSLHEAAERLGMDPAEVKHRNILRPGDPHALYGHTVGPSFRGAEALKAAVDHPWWRDRAAWKEQATGPWVRGTGISAALKGCGYGSAKGDRAGARLSIGTDGSITIWAGPNHTGQFIETAYAQVAADALGRDYDEIDVVVGDTELVPESGSCTASRSLYAGGAAVVKACDELLSRIREAGLDDPVDWSEAGRRLGAAGEALVEVYHDTPNVTEFGEMLPDDLLRLGPHRVYSSAVQVARVEVNRFTGQVEVRGVLCAIDCGTPVNPAGVIGQTEGAILQGIGWALMEEFKLDEGVPQTTSLETYLIPTAGDAPELETIIVDGSEETGPFGAKGAAEVALVPTAPAVIAAIRDAVGVTVDRLPATPETVYRLMEGSGS
jgi:CO/xanthine dehydrogenase Mo-binding subunit